MEWMVERASKKYERSMGYDIDKSSPKEYLYREGFPSPH